MDLAQYLIVATDLLATKDKEKIIAEIVNIKTPKTVLPENFTIKWLDHYGRVAIILYRGIEVLLLFKRMTSLLSSLTLDIAPRAFLKNDDEAWEAFKLVEAYTGVPIGERIKELEIFIKQKDSMIEMLQLQLDASDDLCLELQTKQRKKTSSIKFPPPLILCSASVNKYLLKIKPTKLQDIVRAQYLHSQGFNTDLVHGPFPAPTTPANYRKRAFNHLTKLGKLLKTAKLDKELAAYEMRPPKVKAKKVVVKKSTKKVVKKKKRSK